MNFGLFTHTCSQVSGEQFHRPSLLFDVFVLPRLVWCTITRHPVHLSKTLKNTYSNALWVFCVFLKLNMMRFSHTKLYINIVLSPLVTISLALSRSIALCFWFLKMCVCERERERMCVYFVPLPVRRAEHTKLCGAVVFWVFKPHHRTID